MYGMVISIFSHTEFNLKRSSLPYIFMRSLIAISVLGLPLLGMCQIGNETTHALSLGFKLDLQASGIANQNNYGQNEMDYTVTPGFGAGAVITYELNPINALQLEVSYQTGGQDYDDRFKGRHFKKEINYSLLSVPLLFRHQLSKPQEGYAGVGGSKPLWYFLAGVQIDRILSPEINWYLDGTAVDFLSFVQEGGNPNQQAIDNLGPPASATELFTQWDGMIIVGGGFQLPMSEVAYLSLELRGGVGLTDINAEPWRLNNNKGIYQASRLAFLGLHAGIHMQLAHQ
jgi:hypothetical protein